jgi:hypothetical protein
VDYSALLNDVSYTNMLADRRSFRQQAYYLKKNALEETEKVIQLVEQELAEEHSR